MAGKSVYDTDVDSGILKGAKVGALSPYQNIDNLLKAMPAAQSDVQKKTADNFQDMLKKGLGIDESVARPLDDALAADPPKPDDPLSGLQGKIVQMWQNHPKDLNAVIPTIKANPQDAATIVTTAYNRDYPTALPLPSAAQHADYAKIPASVPAVAPPANNVAAIQKPAVPTVRAPSPDMG